MTETDDQDHPGSLEIHPDVVRKLAARAVRLVPGARPSAAIKVGEVGGGELELAVRLALRYPAPVRAAAEAVRRHVTDEVERITGHRVRSVALTVSALDSDTRPRVV
ncbi:Asp23/Gls24 family envelope stress response protein [Actinosynnema sp. NPDC053489]|uniref:Asp23/Gls24 family envelope stress response protein n=1 Tax=Actinosynnema sp. NPDC053489 TaxID=3363916 RepID=UPI0037C7F205